jgi:hypothetical protein
VIYSTLVTGVSTMPSSVASKIKSVVNTFSASRKM